MKLLTHAPCVLGEGHFRRGYKFMFGQHGAWVVIFGRHLELKW